MDELHANANLPKRLAWFAPWRWFSTWKPWQRWTLAVMIALVGYVLSPMPLLITVERIGGRPARDAVAFTIYLPLVGLCAAVPAVDHKFYQRQEEWLRRRFGEP